MAILIDPFPVSRLKKIFQRSPMTLSYTNLPGPAKLYLQDDFLIKDFTFTNPNRLETGMY